eukprot:GFUD01098856.1.p2 GENE.GFUD01098856.1~~GFUD01098856.1.p2  ORF type:complete len:130 (-),score=41.29 GFUD01098856.1:318-707(-)
MDSENSKENVFLTLNGLVWSATEDDIKIFLHDCRISEVVITTIESGKPSGNALVHLENKADVQKARAHNREYLRERFVIIEQIEESQFINETEKDQNPTNKTKIEAVIQKQLKTVEKKNKGGEVSQEES